MNVKLTFITLFTCFLCACSSSTPPPNYNLSQTDQSLAEASYAVSRSISDLAETSQAAHPLAGITPPPAPATYGMDATTSIDWSGPVEPVVRKIADAANYRLTVLGNSPAIPVLVTVYRKNAMLGDILRDVGYQCGERATVAVFPGTRTIELRYAKS